MLKLFVISSFCMFQVAYGTCLESADSLTSAVDKLKVQFLCSNDEDLNNCNKLFKNATKERSEITRHHSQSCEEGGVSPKILPLVTPITEVSKVLEFGSSKRTYVNSHFDFYHHTKLHIQRMNALALELYRKYPSEFPGVDERMIKDVLSYHDRAKIDPNVKFNGKGFYETLYKYYGNVPPRDVIDKLNEYDDGFIKSRLQNLGISNAQNSEQVIKSLERLEKISDSVDRAMNPVSEEEFGRKMWKESKFAKDPTHKSMALYLEKNYKKLVGDKFYQKMTPDELSELKFRLVVNSQFSDKLSLAQKQMAKSKVTLAKFKKSLNQSFVSKTLKGLGRFALATTAIVDGVLLAIYPTAISCTSELGHHGWKIEGGKCVPTTGLDMPFMEFLNLSEMDMQSALAYEKHTCKVLKHNLSENEDNYFNNITCREGQIDFSLNKKSKLSITVDNAGNKKKVYFTGPGFGNSLKSVELNSLGKIVKTCRVSPRMFIETCISGGSAKARGLIQALNFKIQQGVDCCAGQVSDLNKKINCSS